MYPNLLGQARYHHMSNEDMAKAIGVKRPSYERKVKNGRFTAKECKIYCALFNKSFDYLFAEDGDELAR